MSDSTSATTMLERAARALAVLGDSQTTKELHRLFSRDARQAYRTLADRSESAREPGGPLRNFARGANAFFNGLGRKLSPARRVLFVVALVAAIPGLARLEGAGSGIGLSVRAGPLVAVGLLVLLLALELVDRLAVRDELEVARALQRELLPTTLPPVKGYAFAHSYRTANEVGGDYYDVVPLPDGRVALLIGDASGHGMAAGLLMAIANAVLRLALDLDPRPEAVARLLNRVLARTGDRRAFMTLFVALLDPSAGTLRYVCAGHPFPLLRRGDGRVEELGEGSLPLGLREEVDLSPAETFVAPGDLLLLYSDGLAEAVDAQGHAFGFDRVEAILARATSVAATHDVLLATLDRHLGGEPPQDDVSVLVIGRQADQP